MGIRLIMLWLGKDYLRALQEMQTDGKPQLTTNSVKKYYQISAMIFWRYLQNSCKNRLASVSVFYLKFVMH